MLWQVKRLVDDGSGSQTTYWHHWVTWIAVAQMRRCVQVCCSAAAHAASEQALRCNHHLEWQTDWMMTQKWVVQPAAAVSEASDS
jgi:hypothetical protein